MNHQHLLNLEQDIEMARRELHLTVELTGMHSLFSIQCSVKLDYLLNHYEKLKQALNKKQKNPGIQGRNQDFPFRN